MNRMTFFLNIFCIFFVLNCFAEEESDNSNFYVSKAEFDIEQKVFINSDYAYQKSDEIFILKEIVATQKKDNNKDTIIKSKKGAIDNKNKIVFFENGTINSDENIITFESAKINAFSENVDEGFGVNLKNKSLEIKSDYLYVSRNDKKNVFKKNVLISIENIKIKSDEAFVFFEQNESIPSKVIIPRHLIIYNESLSYILSASSMNFNNKTREILLLSISGIYENKLIKTSSLIIKLNKNKK